MTWEQVLSDSIGYLLGSFALGWAFATLITHAKKVMEKI